MAGSNYIPPDAHLVRHPVASPWTNRTPKSQPAWWSWGALGSSGSLIGPQTPSVGSKPRKKPQDPHLRYGTHQPHGEDAGDSASPGATDSNSPNYGSGSFTVDTDPMVSDIDMAIGMVHGIGTPGSFDATLAGGGIGTHAMSVLPGQHGLPYDGYADPTYAVDQYTDDPAGAYQPYADDPYSPPLREPNRRNYKADFGDEVGFEHEFFSGFGISAVIGCEEDEGLKG
jgi:hypothetical protein